jgi:hypothetical protein
MIAKKQKAATIRCAIYTRKSTEEGLEQEFNSLDAQRDAGESYIASQRFANGCDVGAKSTTLLTQRASQSREREKIGERLANTHGQRRPRAIIRELSRRRPSSQIVARPIQRRSHRSRSSSQRRSKVLRD